MPCTWVRLPNGVAAIVKTSGARRRRCSSCSAWAGFLCDFEVLPGKTCDKPLCGRHAIPVGRDLHLCPYHHNGPMAA